jgi:hypothetical protein
LHVQLQVMVKLLCPGFRCITALKVVRLCHENLGCCLSAGQCICEWR